MRRFAVVGLSGLRVSGVKTSWGFLGAHKTLLGFGKGFKSALRGRAAVPSSRAGNLQPLWGTIFPM